MSRVVVVTGGSAGVGRATVRRFAERGDDVGILARGPDGLAATQREVEELGGRAVALPVDVADETAVEAAADVIEERLGPIDVWINNAMVTVLAPVKELEARDVRRVAEVNYLGAVHGTLSALRRMLPRDRGVIVQVGSALAYRAIPLQAAYCGSKHALRGFTDSLRSELLHDDSAVGLVMVHLPALNTPQFEWCKTTLPRQPQPVPPIFQPEVAAEAIVFAADHPERREVWAGWPTVQAIVGNKLVPGLADRYLARTGYDGQQTDEPIDPQRQVNLYRPVAGDHGAHGRFDDRAQVGSGQLWASENRSWLIGAGALLAGAGALLLRRR